MKLVIGVVKETMAGETRVAIAPDVVQKLCKQGVAVVMQKDAGASAHMTNEKYKGDALTLVAEAEDVYAKANFFVRVQAPTLDEVAKMPEGSYLLGALNPHKHLDVIKALAAKNIISWATEYIPRISRAQSMDTLSSQAAVAGYLGVLKAANLSSKFFPMLTTAAGTVRPAKVLVLGAGVAGLQAIATAKRLGAVVEAYDIRPETKEQCESLGASFIDTGVSAAGEGGYARELSQEELAKQADVVDQHIAKADAVITTAAIPGRPSPKLVSAAVVEKMQPGAVVVDLAAEGGGNCELTRVGDVITHNAVVICGETNLPAQLPIHASEMFSKNSFNFISPWLEEGEMKLDWDDEILAQSCLTKDGNIVSSRLIALLEAES